MWCLYHVAGPPEDERSSPGFSAVASSSERRTPLTTSRIFTDGFPGSRPLSASSRLVLRYDGELSSASIVPPSSQIVIEAAWSSADRTNSTPPFLTLVVVGVAYGVMLGSAISCCGRRRGMVSHRVSAATSRACSPRPGGGRLSGLRLLQQPRHRYRCGRGSRLRGLGDRALAADLSCRTRKEYFVQRSIS